ncbi:hypothetical protein JTB14_015347 [Gonioctena quinquepunctata]|nr:hypothetical protein JTB14_015347 [Gonioctena quinquepunctata]
MEATSDGTAENSEKSVNNENSETNNISEQEKPKIAEKDTYKVNNENKNSQSKVENSEIKWCSTLEAEQLRQVCDSVYYFAPKEIENNPKLKEYVSQMSENTKNNETKVSKYIKKQIAGPRSRSPPKMRQTGIQTEKQKTEKMNPSDPKKQLRLRDETTQKAQNNKKNPSEIAKIKILGKIVNGTKSEKPREKKNNQPKGAEP